MVWFNCITAFSTILDTASRPLHDSRPSEQLHCKCTRLALVDEQAPLHQEEALVGAARWPRRAIRAATYPPLKPLSMFTTTTFAEQAFSIVSSGATPLKAAP